jgi:hypothetical protein
MQSAREIREHCRRFIVGVRINIKNARRHPRRIDRLDRLRQSWPGSRRRRKLRSHEPRAKGRPQRDRSGYDKNATQCVKPLLAPASAHRAASASAGRNGHSRRTFERTK